MSASFENYDQFLNHIEHTYSEEDQLKIKTLIAYYVNEYTGHYEKYHQEIYINSLIAGLPKELHHLVFIGVEFEKQFIHNIESEQPTKRRRME